MFLLLLEYDFGDFLRKERLEVVNVLLKDFNLT